MLYLLLVGLAVAIIFALRPFFGAAKPMPADLKPQELREELNAIKSQAALASGEERTQLLVQAVYLERQLAELGSENLSPTHLNPLLASALVCGLGFLGFGLWNHTLPRLPGETIITSRSEARELGDLQRKAEKSSLASDWLAYANRSYELRALDQAVKAYLKVAELEPRNPTAIRRIGMLLFMSSRPKEAIQALELATAAEPKVSEGWLFLGNAYFQEGQLKRAVSAWENYLASGGPAKEQVQNLIQTAKAQLGSASPGRQVYLAKCAACHGADALGGSGPRLKDNPIRKIPEAVSQIVRQGRGSMAAVALSPEELQVLLKYLGGL
jgi:cytochrome c-type biogenesis protein CcmH/NrfG